jgi:HEAT repeat protein
LFAEVAVRDPDPPVRLAAVQALTADRGVAATAVLAAIAVGDPVVEVRVKAVGGLDGRDLDRTIGEELVGLIDDQQHPQIRLAALGVLKNTRPRGVDLAAVFRDRMARDTVAYVFAAAAAAAVENADSIAHLWEVIAARAASDDNPQVRSAAVTLLGAAAGYGEALDVLIERLRHDADPAVIGVAATAVAVLAPERARELLVARLSAPDPEIRAAVVEALERWVDADAGIRIAVSSEARTDKSPHVRRTAVEALAPAVKHPEVQETLARCAEDEDMSVSEAAERLLRFRPL